MSKIARLINMVGVLFLVSLVVMLSVSLLKKNLYDSAIGINILFLAKDGAGIIAVREGSGMVSLTRLPDNLLIPVGANGGTYQVEAIYKVGLPVKNGTKVGRESVGSALGVVLSGVVKFKSDLGLGGLSEALISPMTETNLSYIDRYDLYKDIRSLLAKKTNFEIAFPGSITDEEVEPDGKKVAKLNSGVFVWSQNQWVFDEILAEATEVTVVNATGREGAARAASKQMETAGVRVVELVTADRGSSECLIRGDERSYRKTYLFLMTAFSCRKAQPGEGSEFGENEVNSDLTVILGEKN